MSGFRWSHPDDRVPTGVGLNRSVNFLITVTGIELRAGARLLVSDASLQIGDQDRVGLVGRNGAGKTTLMRVMAGELAPAAGSVSRSSAVGYLPQDPGVADPHQTVRARLLSARGLAELEARMRRNEKAMTSADVASRELAMAKYAKAELAFVQAGGYAAEAQAAAIAAGLGIVERQLHAELGTLSGGQRRRVELARLLFAGHSTLLLDEPTNHLDADSVLWLRKHLAKHSGGLVLISHDLELVEAVVNKVAFLDGNRCVLDVYNMGWRNFQKTSEADERRRRRERDVADRTATRLTAQAEKMRAKATKARAAQQMLRRAEQLREQAPELAVSDRIARVRFPDPAPCGRVPLTASGLAKAYGALDVFNGVDLAIDRGSRVVVLGLNGAGKTTLLRILAGVEVADEGSVEPGFGLRIGYYAQEHETLDRDKSVLANAMASSVDLTEQAARDLLGRFLFSGDRVDQDAGTLSGGERTRLALACLVTSGANVLLLDEPTNNLDPASREQVLDALNAYPGAVILVTHDVGAVDALDPERVLLLPDGDEDLWNDSYRELVTLA